MNKPQTFRKKSAEVEAILYEPRFADVEAVAKFLGGAVSVDRGCIAIQTLEGVKMASPGDWIIKGTRGEFYPCKPEIFNDIYESLEDTQARAEHEYGEREAMERDPR